MVRVRILDRYIFRELVAPFFLSMAALTLVMLLQKMVRLAELVVSKGATLWSTIKLLLYIMPGFLVITIPMSLLVAALTAFMRLSSDAEVTAMKASCVSLYDMLRPVMVFALLSFAATAVTSVAVLPDANHALKVHLFDMVKSRAMVGIEPGVFTSTFDGMIVYVDKMKSLDNMEGIFISDERSARDPYVITARRGKLMADPESFNVTLAMEEGSVHTVPRDDRSYTVTAFDAGKLYLDINHALLPKRGQLRDFNETPTLELVRIVKRNKAEGRSVLDPESELHKRFSIPVACLVFGLIGVPLGIRRSRSGKSAGIAVALGVFLVYYMLLGTGKNLAEARTFSPAAAYWVPNGLMLLAAALFVVLKAREIDLGIAHRIARLFGGRPKGTGNPA